VGAKRGNHAQSPPGRDVVPGPQVIRQPRGAVQKPGRYGPANSARAWNGRFGRSGGARKKLWVFQLSAGRGPGGNGAQRGPHDNGEKKTFGRPARRFEFSGSHWQIGALSKQEIGVEATFGQVFFRFLAVPTVAAPHSGRRGDHWSGAHHANFPR